MLGICILVSVATLVANNLFHRMKEHWFVWKHERVLSKIRIRPAPAEIESAFKEMKSNTESMVTLYQALMTIPMNELSKELVWEYFREARRLNDRNLELKRTIDQFLHSMKEKTDGTRKE